jgi:hypothetical protein
MQHIFYLSKDGDQWSASDFQKTDPSVHCLGGLVAPRAGLDSVERRKTEPRFLGPSVHSLVTIQTELSRVASAKNKFTAY